MILLSQREMGAPLAGKSASSSRPALRADGVSLLHSGNNIAAWNHQPLEGDLSRLTKGGHALYDRILVALRGDEIDEAMLHEVAGLAYALGATLVLLQVTHTHSRDTSSYLREQALAYLGARALELRRQGLGVEVAVREGEPWEEICGLAENGSIDLLAMGKHHHSQVRDLISGSETERVIRSCRVSVLLIDSGPGKHRN